MIVAISKDPRAPIFNEATNGPVGDLSEVVHARRTKLKETR